MFTLGIKAFEEQTDRLTHCIAVKVIFVCQNGRFKFCCKSWNDMIDDILRVVLAYY